RTSGTAARLRRSRPRCRRRSRGRPVRRRSGSGGVAEAVFSSGVTFRGIISAHGVARDPVRPSTSLAAGRRILVVNGDVAPVDETDRDVAKRRDVNVVVERRIVRSPIDHLDLIGNDSTEARPLDLGVAAPYAVRAGARGTEAVIANIRVDGAGLHINL